jgi:hypothetical protein
MLPTHVALARIDLAAGHADLAAMRLQTAIGHAANGVDPSQPYLSNARLWLAVADAQAGRCDQARAGVRDALARAGKGVAEPHPLLADARAALRGSVGCERLSE